MKDKLLRLPRVLENIPYSRAAIYEKVARGEFPRPIRLGARAVAWLESDLDAWIAARAAIPAARERP